MRDLLVHLSWLATHFVRTWWGDQQARALLDSLASEVEVLQAELHRTHRILSGYGTLIDRCDRQHWLVAFGNFWFFGVLLILVVLLFATWCRRKSTRQITLGETGGSSESSDSGPTSPALTHQKQGLCRPSTFGRGKR